MIHDKQYYADLKIKIDLMLKNHKSIELSRIPNLSNELLLEEYTYMSQGDDYDGGMTQKGTIAYIILSDELKKRLKEIGFLRT